MDQVQPQIILCSPDERQIVCLILSTKQPSGQLTTTFVLKKDEDFFINKILRLGLASKERFNLAIFAVNDSNPSRPMNPIDICQCIIETEGSAAFLLRTCDDNLLNEAEQQNLLTLLQNHLRLPQNLIRKVSSKRGLGESGNIPALSEPKRQQIEAPLAIIPLPRPEPCLPLVIKQEAPPEDRPWRQTTWNGTVYRSKLEAQTACFMQYAGVDFRYERVQCLLGYNNSNYTPDFWLPHQHLFIEVKPAYPHVDEIAKCEAVAASGFNIVLMYGRVGAAMAYEDGNQQYRRTYTHSDNSRGIAWSGLTGERLAGDWIWIREGETTILSPLRDSHDVRWRHEKLNYAYDYVYHGALRPQ